MNRRQTDNKICLRSFLCIYIYNHGNIVLWATMEGVIIIGTNHSWWLWRSWRHLVIWEQPRVYSLSDPGDPGLLVSSRLGFCLAFFAISSYEISPSTRLFWFNITILIRRIEMNNTFMMRKLYIGIVLDWDCTILLSSLRFKLNYISS